MKRVLYYLALAGFACMFCFAGWKVWSYYSEGQKSEAQYEDLSQLLQEATPTVSTDPTGPKLPNLEGFEPMTPEEIIQMPENPYLSLIHPETGKVVLMLPQFKELFLRNCDIIGWISIEGTKVDYPVVQRKQTQDYYIKRDFYREYSSRGCIYAREQCDIFPRSDNIILYGHMMRDGTMFATLNNYTDPSYRDEHPYIRFDTLLGQGTYEVICVFKTTAVLDKGFRYHTFVDIKDEATLNNFWRNCLANAIYYTGLEPEFGDQLLTLSTCEYTLEEGRLVVVARRIDN